jgi:uncharacterized protein YwgA
MSDKVLCVLNNICDVRVPGKKMVQKLMYLIQRSGVDLGLDYKIHFYGPYSTDLDHLLHMYEVNSILDIDTSGVTHKIKFIEDKMISNVLNTNEELIVKNILDLFANKTPSELELLTTTDFVALELDQKNILSQDEIVSNVKRIKGRKFSEQAIENSIQELKKVNLIIS